LAWLLAEITKLAVAAAAIRNNRINITSVQSCTSGIVGRQFSALIPSGALHYIATSHRESITHRVLKIAEHPSGNESGQGNIIQSRCKWQDSQKRETIAISVMRVPAASLQID
jgi:hypothetical protein